VAGPVAVLTEVADAAACVDRADTFCHRVTPSGGHTLFLVHAGEAYIATGTLHRNVHPPLPQFTMYRVGGLRPAAVARDVAAVIRSRGGHGVTKDVCPQLTGGPHADFTIAYGTAHCVVAVT
jgi:hypothetical protein